MADTKLEAAYKLVYDNEKALAEELVALVDEFKAKLEELRAKVPEGGNQSLITQTINQYSGFVSNYQYTYDGLRQHYDMPIPTISMP